MTTVYLDSSAVTKRYVLEPGTEHLDGLYHRAEAGGLGLAFSLWNVGEVARALMRAQATGRLESDEVREVLWNFLRETRKMRLLGALRVVPVRGDLLAEAVALLLRRGLSQPDALQIATSRDLAAEAFVAADRRLLEAARAEGLRALDAVADGDALQDL